MAGADVPRVLVVVPTLGRRPKMLAECLASIRDQGQMVSIVVVRPRDATHVDRLADQVSALCLDDPGSLPAAINAGFAAYGVGHEYVGWLGDDDLLEVESVRAVSSALDRNPRASVAFGYCRYIDADGATLWISRVGRWAPWILPWGPDLVPQPGMLVRADAWRSIGGLDTSFRFAFDLDLLLRLRHVGPLVPVHQVVSSFRWHADSLTVGDRETNIAETERARRKVLPPALRPLAPMWEVPVRAATRVAAARISRRAVR